MILDHILFWPIQLRGNLFDQQVVQEWAAWFQRRAGNEWTEVDALDRGQGLDEKLRLAEFVYFHPFVRSILFGNDEKRPLRILKRLGIRGVRVVLGTGVELTLSVRRIHLYLFDTRVAVLVVEVFSTEHLEVATVQTFLDSFRRAYRPYYDTLDGHCPKSVTWLECNSPLMTDGPVSNYGESELHAQRVYRDREPPHSDHWKHLLGPLIPWSRSVGEETPAWRQVADERMPGMTFLAVRNPRTLTRGDWVRLAFQDDGGDPETLPYSSAFLEEFEARFSYDRYWDPDSAKHTWMTTRFICVGSHLLVAGTDDHESMGFVTDEQTGLLFHFRHHYFQLGLLVYMQHASLLVFLDRLYRIVDRNRRESREGLHKLVQQIQRDFVEFTAGFWFTEVTSHIQGRELYQIWIREMGTQRLYDEVKAEIQLTHETLSGMESLQQAQQATVLSTEATNLSRWGQRLAPLALGLSFLGMNVLVPQGSTALWVQFTWAGVTISVAYLLAWLIARFWSAR